MLTIHTPHKTTMDRLRFGGKLTIVLLVKLVALVVLLCVSGCARTVNVVHSDLTPEQEVGDIFGTRVVVQALPASEHTNFSRSGFLAVGIYNNWDIDFASTLPQAVADALANSFSDVSVENTYTKGCEACGMIVRPRVTDFGLNKLTMQASIELEVRVYDANENLVSTFTHKGKSPILSLGRAGVMTAGYFIPFSGTIVGNPVVNATVKDALDEALADVRTTFVSESQAGGELARVWRPKKIEFGAHEYAAELVARDLGCDMTTDGLSLISNQYGKEVYDAYCWRQGTFTISCELGRCAANINPARPVAIQNDVVDSLN